MTDVLVGAPPIVPTGVTVPCVYCLGAVAADSFVDWPDGKPLLSADCPSCAKRVTLPSAFLRRWTRNSEPLSS
jgi:hypothetical protein